MSHLALGSSATPHFTHSTSASAHPRYTVACIKYCVLHTVHYTVHIRYSTESGNPLV